MSSFPIWLLPAWLIGAPVVGAIVSVMIDGTRNRDPERSSGGSHTRNDSYGTAPARAG